MEKMNMSLKVYARESDNDTIALAEHEERETEIQIMEMKEGDGILLEITDFYDSTIVVGKKNGNYIIALNIPLCIPYEEEWDVLFEGTDKGDVLRFLTAQIKDIL